MRFLPSLVALALFAVPAASLGAVPAPTPFPSPTPAPVSPIVLNETPSQSDAFVNSVGINTHFSLNAVNGYYDMSIIPLLRTLGIRHIRDNPCGTTDPSRLLAAISTGVTVDAVIAFTCTQTQFNAIEGQLNGAVDQFEGPNESDEEQPGTWLSTLPAFQASLYSWDKTNPATANIPVVAPSIVQYPNYLLLGSLASVVDYGNVHDYAFPYNPEISGQPCGNSYGTMAIFGKPLSYCALNLASVVSGTKPVESTESGFNGMNSMPSPMPTSPATFTSNSVQARYIPRSFLNHWNLGFARSYVYQLEDQEDPTLLTSLTFYSEFGLIPVQGNPVTGLRSPKPAFWSTAALLNALSDPGPSFTTLPLAYTITGNVANLNHTLFQKRNGEYFLALWLGVSCVDPATGAPIVVPSQQITITTVAPLPTPTVLFSTDDSGIYSAATMSAWNGTSGTINVSDKYTLVELGWSPNTQPELSMIPSP